MENTRVGPFLIIKRIGNNRRQKVYQALQVEQEKEVALKFIAVPPSVDWNKAIDKINLEVRVLQKLRHPNLVRLYGAGVVDNKIFLAHELVAGESLTGILSRRGRLAPDLVVEIGRQIAELLQFLHQQDAMHAKLTPDKIIIDENHRVKVADLRLNRSRRKRWDDSKKHVMDIAAYMAPEQFGEGATKKSDLYSLGVILYEMLTGKLPYEPDTMGRMNRRKMKQEVPSVAASVMNCPIWLDRIVCQMLSPSPRKRPHSARAVVLALDEIKKIDTNRKAAVTQISGNFNPLTAGTDKTEANRLLGKKASMSQVENRPFYERVPFLVCALVLIVATIWFAVLPTSSNKLYRQAEMMMESGDNSQWRRARTNLRTIMDRGSDDEFFVPATDLYFESRRRTMVEQAENGRALWTQSENTKRIGKAIQLQGENQLEQARGEYRALLTTVDPAGDERHIHIEAERRLAEIERASQLSSEPAAINLLIEQLLLADTPDQIAESIRKLTEMIGTYSDKSGYEPVVKLAQNAIDLLHLKKEELEQTRATDDRQTPNQSIDTSDRSGSRDDS